MSTNTTVVLTELKNRWGLLKKGLKVMSLDMRKMEMNMYGNVKYDKKYNMEYLILSTCIASRSDVIGMDILIIELYCEEQEQFEVKVLQKH